MRVATRSRAMSDRAGVDDDEDGDERGGGSGDGDSADTDGSTEPADAFARLGNETRLSILDVLHDRLSVGDRSDYTVTYTELREAVGEEDSGKFGYHLNQLLGEFVEKRPGGYAIQYPGKELVRTVESGAVEPASSGESGPTDATCFLCEAPVSVSYVDGYVSARCTECDGALDFDFTPEGALSSLPVPAGAVGEAVETAPRELLDRVHGRFCHRSRMFGDGTCPRCSGPATASIRVCPDHDAGDGPCRECRTVLPATVRTTCEVCGEDGISPGGCVVSHRAPFRDALADAGVEGLGFEAFGTMFAWPLTATERDGDPALAFDLPGGPDRVVVDGDLAVHVEE